MEQNNVEVLLRKIKKETLASRIFSMISMILMVGVFTFSLISFINVQKFISEAQPVVEELSKLDADLMNETMDNMNFALENMDWERLCRVLDEIDFAGINNVLGNIDMEEFSELLENINDAADRLEEMEEWLDSSSFNFWKKEE